MAVHDIHRVYHAVCYGNLKEDAGTVCAPIDATRATANGWR